MNYTVKEVANQIKRSETFVYELLNKGVISKVNGVTPVKISKQELTRYKKSLRELPFNPDKVEVIKTKLGDIRKIKGENLYILNDLATIAKISSSGVIKERVNKECVKLIPFEKIKQLGLSDFNIKGASAITLKGIEEYLSKTRTKADWDDFMGDICVYISTPVVETKHIKEKEIESNGLQIIEQREVLGKKFKIYGTIENPLFLAKDVAEWIEYDLSSINKMLNSVDEDEKLLGTIFRAGQKREVSMLTEDGLYEVLMQSRKPIAKQFKKKVKEILRQIRLTGGYVANNPKFINNYFSNFSIELKHEMIAELELNIEQLHAEKEKIDNQLLEKINVIDEIKSTL